MYTYCKCYLYWMFNIFCNFEIDFHILTGTNVLYINSFLSKLCNTTYGIYSICWRRYIFFFYLVTCFKCSKRPQQNPLKLDCVNAITCRIVKTTFNPQGWKSIVFCFIQLSSISSIWVLKNILMKEDEVWFTSLLWYPSMHSHSSPTKKLYA